MDSKTEIDLTGKLIIKVQLNDDIRRIPIHNEALTLDELVLMMQRVYKGKLNSNDDITIKYKDEDGDLITIFDSTDLCFAIQCSHILKLQIFLNNEEKSEQNEPNSLPCLTEMKLQLRTIRDQVNKLLDGLNYGQNDDKSSDNNSDKEGSSTTIPLSATLPSFIKHENQQIKHINPSEFDPLVEKEKEMEICRQQQLQNQSVRVTPISTAGMTVTPVNVNTNQMKYVNSNIPLPAQVVAASGYSQVPAQMPYPQQHYANYPSVGYSQAQMSQDTASMYQPNYQQVQQPYPQAQQQYLSQHQQQPPNPALYQQQQQPAGPPPPPAAMSAVNSVQGQNPYSKTSTAGGGAPAAPYSTVSPQHTAGYNMQR